MSRQQRHVGRMSFSGAGFIARTILDMFARHGWTMDAVSVFAHHHDSALAQAGHPASRPGLPTGPRDLLPCPQAALLRFAATAPSTT
ncbi:pyridoxal-5'-phosphate-dependent protein, partial [Pseudomonas syringae]